MGMAVFLSPTPHFSSKSSPSAPFIVVGKKKKSKPQQNTGQEPPRITSNLKQNLQILRLQKEYQKRKAVPPRMGARYRKKKSVEVLAPNEEDLEDPTTSTTDDEYEDCGSAGSVLLVDGYNVCGYWPKLKIHFTEGRLETAREMLIDELRFFSARTKYQVVVVFDAIFSGRRTNRKSSFGIDIVFTSHTCADNWIVNEACTLVENGYEVFVASSDVVERQCASAAGAYRWSCETLVCKIEDSRREYEKMQRLRRLSETQKLVKEEIINKENKDRPRFRPEVVNALKELRNRLVAGESAQP